MLVASSPADTLAADFQHVRTQTVRLCDGLEIEDYVVQPMTDASPTKWHLGHMTWFWETFVLQPNVPGYLVFHDEFSFVFNSYYETVGRRSLRTQRGNLSRPTVAEIYRYRAYVDEQMDRFLSETTPDEALTSLIRLGLEHEMQHQELLVTDIKYTLGHNPLLPALAIPIVEHQPQPTAADLTLKAGVYTVGHQGDDFCFDNELGAHQTYLHETTLSGTLVTNAEYLEFMEAGGYKQFQHWLSDGWAWVNAGKQRAPLYWYHIDGQWLHYTFDGLQPLAPDAPVCHVSFYEADAYARWKGQRLPTEFEWEVARQQGLPNVDQRWEWTGSAYLPYPGFKTATGAVGEYNGKFMSSQMVLRGASVATPPTSIRPTYRNFFQPDKQWQYTGIRLVHN